MFEKNFVTENIVNKYFEVYVKEYVGLFADIWRSCDTKTHGLGITYSTREKLKHEKNLEKFLSAIKKEAKKNGYSAKEQLKNHEKYSGAIKSFLMDGLNFKAEEIDILFSNKFLKVTSEFIETARLFDPKISPQDIFQALRNVWTMNWVQYLLDLPVELTPSIFAYSMLYPYTDNYLDNADISQIEKMNFNNRLTQRLEGIPVEPLNSNERTIYDLLGMIESQHDRSIYPEVFESLLAIHRAQIKSLWLMDSNREISDSELLNISLEKGGTSVLADGYLVAGNLTREQRIFLFGYGAYLQLIDDLQDVREDSKSNFNTLYSKSAGKYPLDELMNRTHNFGGKVLSIRDQLLFENKSHAFEIMKKSNILMLIGAVAITSDYYSSTYNQKIESHSAFHFSFWQKQQESLQNSDLMSLNFLKFID